MTAALALIWRDPMLRLVAGLLVLFGATNASVFPYQSDVSINRVGLSDGQFALVLLLASALAVAASVAAGIVADQRANRRQVALLTCLAAVLGPALMLVAPSVPSLVLCHGVLLPITASLFGQGFALARLACADRPDQRDAVLSGLRALLSLTFLIVLPLWSLVFALGVDVMAIYGLATACGAALLVLTWRYWPRDGATVWADAPSGLSLWQSLAEIAQGGVLLRLGLLGCITAAAALYMVLISLVFAATPGRTASDVALFVGLVAGFEVPFMLLLPRVLRFVPRVTLIAAGGMLYACYLALVPVLAGSALVWLLPVLAGLSGAATLTLPIAYLQDLMADRPGAGSSLLAVQKVAADTVCAGVFAGGMAVGGYGTVALAGALIAAAGSVALLALDRWLRPAALG
jgi:SET family sugar efflux transporter-like MFS transporter